MQKKNKVLNLLVTISIVVYLLSIIGIPMMSEDKLESSDFEITQYNQVGIWNAYDDEYNELKVNNFDKIIDETELIIKVKSDSISQKYSDFPLQKVEVLDVIKGNCDNKYIDFKEQFKLSYYEKQFDEEVSYYYIQNTGIYLPMNENSEYYLLLNKHSSGAYLLSNIEFGRINVEGDILFTINDYNQIENNDSKKIDDNFDFIGFVNYDEDNDLYDTDYTYTNDDYEEYLSNREKFRIILEGMVK